MEASLMQWSQFDCVTQSTLEVINITNSWMQCNMFTKFIK